MRTLARAAMETDKALEEEDMYWLKVRKSDINEKISPFDAQRDI